MGTLWTVEASTGQEHVILSVVYLASCGAGQGGCWPTELLSLGRRLLIVLGVVCKRDQGVRVSPQSAAHKALGKTLWFDVFITGRRNKMR